MAEKICQYAVSAADEDVEAIMKSLTQLMEIEFDAGKLDEAFEIEDLNDLRKLCIYKDNNNPNRFVMVDLSNAGYIFRLIVRCEEKESNSIKRHLVETINNIYIEMGADEYDMITIDDLKNEYNTEDDSYQEALNRFNLESL